ncbi:MAG TPA: hypothetical protein VFH41_03000 [Bradyrhizobium sp.]|nr:hypothetical protein [Bradyrhizobium sp.]
MRIGTAAVLLACAGTFSWPAAGGEAQNAPSAVRVAQASPTVATEEAPARRVRPPARLRVFPRYAPEAEGIYPRYYPGPNAVRECNVAYVPEYRPSGTVIAPHMSCYWRRG